MRIEVEWRLEVPLPPGERLELERVRVALGDDASALLEAYAEELRPRAGARTGQPFQAGWCSWYYVLPRRQRGGRAAQPRRARAARAEFPIDLVQLDDGYQRAVGDWLETNERFPRGLAPLAAGDPRARAFAPGLWTAPFCVVRESRLFDEHPDWLLRARRRACFAGSCTRCGRATGWVYVLDTSRDDVLAHLERAHAALAGMGFQYLKLDFLYVAALQAQRPRPAR